MVLDQKMKKKQDAQRKHLQAFVDRFRAKATQGAAGAIAHQDAGARCSRSPRWSTDEVRPIHFPAPDKLLSPPIIATDDVDVGYEPGQPVLSGLSLRIDNDDRIALLGSNGNGKSTLVKLLAGRLAPDARHGDARGDAQGRLFRPAPARRARRGPQPLRSRARPDAGTAGSQSARAAPAPSDFPG